MDTNATMIPFYKERVKEIEKEILAIANNAPYVDFRRTRQQLDSGQTPSLHQETSPTQQPITTPHPSAHSMALYPAQYLVAPPIVEEITHHHNHCNAHLELALGVKPTQK